MLHFDRADFVTATGVVMPYDVRRLRPVGVSQHIIDPFIGAVRPAGPAVNPQRQGTITVDMPGTTAAVVEER